MANDLVNLTQLAGPCATYSADGTVHAVLDDVEWTRLRKPPRALKVLIFNQSATKPLYVAVPALEGQCEGASLATGTCTDQRAVMIPPRGFRTLDLEAPDEHHEGAPAWFSLWGGQGAAHPFDLTFSWQTSSTRRMEALLRRLLHVLEPAMALVERFAGRRAS